MRSAIFLSAMLLSTEVASDRLLWFCGGALVLFLVMDIVELLK